MSFFRNWFYLYKKSTLAEAHFEQLIVKLGEPYRTQYPFPHLHRVADFALHLRKIVIEIDGSSHDVLEQRRKDLLTTLALEKMGWSVIRFRNEEVVQLTVPLLREEIERRVITRPTRAELETALLQLPEPVARPSKRRVRVPKPAPKMAKKRRKSA